MKTLISIILLTFSMMAFAGEKFICVQINAEETSPKKMILTQIGETQVLEGKKTPFLLEIYKDGSKPLIKEEVIVTLDDVVLEFKNKSKKISGTIFLDEYDQTSLKIGKEDIRMNCI